MQDDSSTVNANNHDQKTDYQYDINLQMQLIFFLNVDYLILSTFFMPAECGEQKYSRFTSYWNKAKNLFTKRIVGGSVPSKHSHPWVIRIVKLSTSGYVTLTSTFCGGTILNRKFVLTAAHCVPKT
jgi:hypothetical protein